MGYARCACQLAAGFLICLLFLPASASACEKAARPVINITLKEIPVQFDVNQSAQELNKMEIISVSPYPSSYHTEVGGVMNGEIIVDHSMRFANESLEDNTCIVLKEISVEMSISPTIYIASDYQNQACWFKEIFMHEAKHVEVDRKLMRKYKDRFTDALNLILFEPKDYSSGWIKNADYEREKSDMYHGIELAMQVIFDQMIVERNELQGHIDSLEEYERIAKACYSPSS